MKFNSQPRLEARLQPQASESGQRDTEHHAASGTELTVKLHSASTRFHPRTHFQNTEAGNRRCMRERWTDEVTSGRLLATTRKQA